MLWRALSETPRTAAGMWGEGDGQGETKARRPENTGQLGASGHSPGRMQECVAYSGDKRAGTDGKHLSERGTMAGWLTG